MTKESGTTAISAPGPPVEPEPPSIDRTAPPPVPAPGAIALGVLAVGWLAAMLWSAQAEISSSGAGPMAITSAAYALPGVISASLVCGAAVSLALGNALTRMELRHTTARFAGAMGAGLLTGLLAAMAVTLSYGEGPAITVLAGTTAAAATVGGIAGGVRRTLVVAAVVTAGLAVFAVGFALSYYQEPVLSLYGSGDTEASQVTAFRWFSRTSSVASGLGAGLLAFGYLRLAQRRVTGRIRDAVPLRWPAYLIAGAGPGLLLLAAELLTRTAGARVLRLAGAVSEADRAAQSMLGGSRINHALLVLFLGALTATIAFGRTLRPAAESVPDDEPEGPPSPDTESDTESEFDADDTYAHADTDDDGDGDGDGDGDEDEDEGDADRVAERHEAADHLDANAQPEESVDSDETTDRPVDRPVAGAGR